MKPIHFGLEFAFVDIRSPHSRDALGRYSDRDGKGWATGVIAILELYKKYMPDEQPRTDLLRH